MNKEDKKRINELFIEIVNILNKYLYAEKENLYNSIISLAKKKILEFDKYVRCIPDNKE